MKVMICGNSHAGALRRGLVERHARLGHDLVVYPLGKAKHEHEPFSVLVDGEVSYTEESYAKQLERFIGVNRILPGVTWGFMHVNSNSRVYRHGMWRTFEPAILAAPGQCPVSDDLLRTMISRDQAATRSFFGQLRAAGIDFFAVSAPFPRRDNPDFDGRIRRPVVQHVDGVARDVWRRWTAAEGIELIEPPPETRTDDGFLRPEFNAGPLRDGSTDPLHANPDYGALMLDRIVEHLASR